MRCYNIRKLISMYQDGELDDRRSGEVRDHLAGCESCRMEESALREALAMLNAWPAPEPRAGFEAVLSRIEGHARTRRTLIGVARLPLPNWAAAGLAILSIAGGSILAVLPGERAPGARPSGQQVASAMDLHSFNDVLEASVGSGVTAQPGGASDNGGVR
jgi:anti-sigma factor RsiW